MIVLRRLGLILLLALVITLSSGIAAAQMTVTSITENGRPAISTDQIKCIRFADVTGKDTNVKMQLATGDELYGEGGNVVIELRSRKANARFTFYKRFRFIVLSDNAINLRAGKGYVQALDRTAIQSGVIMGTAHTEYAVSITREVPTGYGPAGSSKDQLAQEFVVFEGEVLISDSSAGKVSESKVSTGEKLRVTSGAGIKVAISSEDVTDAATVFAIADTGKAMIRDKTLNYEEIFALYLNQYATVLSEPRNAQARLDLAITQINHGNTTDSTYQLAKAETYAPPDAAFGAAISVARGEVYTQRGDTTAADAEFNKALAQDPKVFEGGSLNALRFKPEVRQRIQKWRDVHKVPWAIGDDFTTRWPLPTKATPPQIDIFNMIQRSEYDNAQRAIGALINRHDSEVDSIDGYLMTILFYERRDIGSARKAASETVEKGRSDGLLTGKEYDALKRNFEKPN